MTKEVCEVLKKKQDAWKRLVKSPSCVDYEVGVPGAVGAF